MSLSPAHGIFLLKGASFSSPRNRAAKGQNKGLGLEDACIKLWVCHLVMFCVEDIIPLHAQQPRTMVCLVSP